MEEAVTLATVPAILALVNLAKSFGISGKWATLLAVILGMAISVIEAVASGGAIYPAAATGLVLGLSASGLYDATAALQPSKPTPSAELDGEGIISADAV